MKYNHTPGPWEVVDKHTAFTIKQALPDGGFVTRIKKTIPSLDAGNAHLIAAAPELLEAAKLFEDLTRRGQPAGSEDLELLQAVIAKAQGA